MDVRAFALSLYPAVKGGSAPLLGARGAKARDAEPNFCPTKSLPLTALIWMVTVIVNSNMSFGSGGINVPACGRVSPLRGSR